MVLQVICLLACAVNIDNPSELNLACHPRLSASELSRGERWVLSKNDFGNNQLDKMDAQDRIN